MRRILAAGMAALTFGGAVAASALPTAAQAHDWRGGYRGGYYGGYGGGDWGYRHHRHNDAAGAAIVAGIAGLAIGAALADSGRRSYYPSYNYGYYDYGYSPGYYGYYQPYTTCVTRRWVWDPYIGRKVMITSRYAC